MNGLYTYAGAVQGGTPALIGGGGEPFSAAELEFYKGREPECGSGGSIGGVRVGQWWLKLTMWFGYALAVFELLPVLFMMWPR